MSAINESKKRKRTESTSKIRVSTLKKSSQPPAELGPVLVNYPALEPHGSTPFRCYAAEFPGAKRLAGSSSRSNKQKRPDNMDVDQDSPDEEPDFHERSTLVVGETKDVEFATDPLETEAAKAQAGCRYLIGIHNSRTGKTVFRPAPLHLVTRTIKAHKSLSTGDSTVPLGYSEARTALGQSFGTKKAQAALRAAERNKVDVNAMKDVVGYLQKGIEAGTVDLPTEEQAAETAASARQIPPLNEDAVTPEEVYPLHSVIPEVEWNAISISEMLEDGLTLGLRMRTLPNARSEWIGDHMKQEFSSDKPKKRSLKMIYYIAALLVFRRVTRSKELDRDNITQKMEGIPGVIVEGMMNRFMEVPRSGSKFKATKDKQNLLCTYIFALCLKVDQFYTDTTVLSRDLALAPASVNTLFKSLGCRIVKVSETQRLKLGIPESQADVKRAQLTCPPTFPKQRISRKAGGRG
jgi:DNA-directed RNA polymerase I subunit RPA49